MGSARKKSAQRYQPPKAMGTAPALVQSIPARVRAEFLFIRADSPDVLANSIDNVEAAVYGTADGELELNCHLVVLFADAPISGFNLIRAKSGLDTSEVYPLEVTAINSPVIGSLHPSLDWATNSRFVVNSKVTAAGLVPGDLLTIAARVGDQARPVSRIYITGVAAATTEEAAA